MRNTGACQSGMGAFSAADNASASAERVCRGSTMPSSHSRAVA
jgi:hypothetical protein